MQREAFSWDALIKFNVFSSFRNGSNHQVCGGFEYSPFRTYSHSDSPLGQPQIPHFRITL